MNKKMIGKLVGVLFFLEALFMLPAIAVCFVYGETGAPLRGFLWTVALLLALSGALYGVCAKATREFYAKEGFIIVALGWILLSAMGALPFYISGEIPHYVDAFFETVSGFTTTGASVLTDVEAMSHGLLYWRSFTHWLGGMGMLVFLLAVVPTGKGAGYSIHLLRAESPGPSVGKMVPRMRQTASLLYKIYIVLTVLCVLFLLAGGMPLFDSLCTAFGTAGTGGFGIKNNSMADYSPYLQNVCTVFMALFGVNFSVYFLLLLREWRGALLDEELLLYGGRHHAYGHVCHCGGYHAAFLRLRRGVPSCVLHRQQRDDDHGLRHRRFQPVAAALPGHPVHSDGGGRVRGQHGRRHQGSAPASAVQEPCG